MDERIIDYLYNRHTNNYVYNPHKEMEDKKYFESLNLTTEQIIEHLREYINFYSIKFAQSYQSVIDENREDFEIIETLKDLFGDVFYTLDEYLTFKRMTECDFAYDEDDCYDETTTKCYGVPDYNFYDDNECFGVDEYNKAFDVASNIKLNDLFKVDLKIIEEGYYHHYGKSEYTQRIFSQFKKIIQFVNEKGTLNKLYGQRNWYNVDFDKLILDIYDFHKKNKSIFKLDQDYEITNERHFSSVSYESGFKEIKEKCSSLVNCGEIYETGADTGLKFDRYRPFLSSNKNKEIDIDKLIFCKNKLESLENDSPMPDANLDIYYITDDDYAEELKQDFVKVYKNFNSDEFRENQANIIVSDPRVWEDANKLNKVKCKLLGNKLIIGILTSVSSEIYYLTHIEVNNVLTDKSAFEIQYNIIPAGDTIRNRIQLLRLDNWEVEGKHKNISNTLNTATHIHLYNAFDLIRGKRNGNYDIAYNITGESTDFTVALETFLNVLCITDDLKKEIKSKVNLAMKKAKEKISHLTVEDEV